MPRTDTMKAMVLSKPGAPLRLEMVPVPTIGANDVLLRVRAAGVGLTVVNHDGRPRPGHVVPAHSRA